MDRDVRGDRRFSVGELASWRNAGNQDQSAECCGDPGDCDAHLHKACRGSSCKSQSSETGAKKEQRG